MKIYFSIDKQGFYHEGFQKNIPKDCIVISEEQYETFYQSLTLGLQAILDENGNILFVDKSSEEEDSSLKERQWRDSELRIADIELNKVQDSDPKAVGTVGQWREYRKALRAWPEHVDFPNKEFRPTSPTIKE